MNVTVFFKGSPSGDPLGNQQSVTQQPVPVTKRFDSQIGGVPSPQWVSPMASAAAGSPIVDQVMTTIVSAC